MVECADIENLHVPFSVSHTLIVRSQEPEMIRDVSRVKLNAVIVLLCPWYTLTILCVRKFHIRIAESLPPNPNVCVCVFKCV